MLAQTIPPSARGPSIQTAYPVPCCNYPHSPAKRIFQHQRKYLNHFQITPKKLYEGLTGKRYDPGQKLTKVEKDAREAAKVTPSTSSATPSTPSTQETEQQQSTTTEVDPDIPPLEDIRPKKKFRFKDPDSKHFSK